MQDTWTKIFCVLCVMALPSITLQNGDFYCSQFFEVIKTRQSLEFTINDNSKEGTVLTEFDPPSIPDLEGVYLLSEDAQFVGLDGNKLVVQKSVRSRNGQSLILAGKCDGVIVQFNVSITVDFNITVNIQDVNDPPVITNLPNTIDLYENMTIGSVVYTVEVNDSYDIHEAFMTSEIRIDRITGLETSRTTPTRMFYMAEGGQLRLVGKLDYETGPRIYKIRIRAKDSGDPPLVSFGRLIVRVLDVNDMPPKFTRESYEARVIGEKPLMGKEECFNITPAIHAFDQDRGVKSQVMYDITEGEPGTRDYWGTFFRLEPTTGMLCQLKVIKRLLRDQKTGRDVFYNFTFTIRAYELEDPSKFDTADLLIHVVDDNSFAPTFERKLYRVSLPEYPRTKSGADIVRVTAEDHDYGQNGEFAYSLVKNPNGMFHIDSASGQITLSKGELFDREKQEFVEIKVRAQETKSVEQNEGMARALINLVDVNDNVPAFSNSTYIYVIKDTLRARQSIHEYEDRPIARDTDFGMNGRVRYSIKEIHRQNAPTLFSDMGRFMMDPDTGVIRLAESLKDLRRKKDYPIYTLVIEATDMAANDRERLSTTAQVYVSIDKANDHRPRFGPSGSSVSRISGSTQGDDGIYHVREDAPIGTIITTITAHDGDGDEDVFLKYWISDGNDDGVFSISSGGRVTLRQLLDKETKDFYNLSVSVTDGQYNASTLIGVFVDDVNDNKPQFELDDYEFQLQEMAPIGTVVGRISATDLDQGPSGDITYQVKSGKDLDAFAIEENGMLIVTKGTPLLDRELNDRIQLRVIATDSGKPPQTNAVDVTIYLEDSNDNPPVFSSPSYYGSVDEDDGDPTPQKVVLESLIKATDEDATETNRNIKYSLMGTGSDKFVIDPRTADIRVAHVGSLDSEENELYQLKVVASDRNGEGNSATADLTIKVKDKNDNAPTFVNEVDIKVNGNVAVGTKIANIVAKDNDVTEPNNRIIYILKDGGFGKFSVDLETGDIMVADAIDREPFHKEYQLRVMAFDGGLPRRNNATVVKIHVPLNEKPSFKDETVRMFVEENKKAGLSPGKVTAFDPDVEAGEQRLTYFMDSKLKLPFKVDQATGNLYTISTLDYESVKEYEFPLYVRDDGSPAKTSSVSVIVTVRNVDDNPPMFVLPQYQGSVREDDGFPNHGQLVIMPANISVFDHDGQARVTLSLFGNQSSLFVVDERTGEIRVSSHGAGRIDREQTDKYDLTLRVTDLDNPRMFSEVDLTIFVRDSNDNAPMFQALSHELYVHENIQIGEEIGRVLANDKDATSPNNDVIYTLESDPYGKFKVDINTGQISVLSGLFFQPRQKTYILTIAAIDLGNPRQITRTTVTIDVLKKNFNDYKPEVLGETIFFVREEVPLGHVVGVLEFVDEDLASGETVDQEIISDWPVPFLIDSLTGEIRTTSRLDHDGGPHAYTFSVMATDNGSPPKEAKINVGVIVEDINDNPPRFTQAEYHHRVADNFPAGTTVATPFAYDDVDMSTSTYTYSFEGEGAGEVFEIDSQTGLVTTTSQLQHVDKEMYEFRLYARDMLQNDLMAVAKLVIDVQMTQSTGVC